MALLETSTTFEAKYSIETTIHRCVVEVCGGDEDEACEVVLKIA
jgi:hypothetical protein